MRPALATLIMVSVAGLLAATGHPILATMPALGAVLLFVLRVFIRVRRQRRARLACGAISKTVATAEAVREGLLPADSVVRTVQLARSEIAHVGAAEARAVLDDLEREAVAHPEGLPGPVVAAARLRFDQLMRANLQ